MTLPKNKITGQGKSASDLKRLLWHKLSDHQKWVVEKMINEGAFIFAKSDPIKFGKYSFECWLIWDRDERTLLPQTFEKLEELGLIEKHKNKNKFTGRYIVP